MKNGINFTKLQDGGAQENDKRAGTENVAEIVGLGKAIELIYNEYNSYNEKLKKLRDYYIARVTNEIKGAKVNGDMVNRLPGNANISFKGVNGTKLLFELDKYGICASAGSACSTGNAEPSHVLTAIGLDKGLIEGTLRISFGNENTIEDVDFLMDVLKEIINK